MSLSMMNAALAIYPVSSIQEMKRKDQDIWKKDNDTAYAIDDPVYQQVFERASGISGPDQAAEPGNGPG